MSALEHYERAGMAIDERYRDLVENSDDLICSHLLDGTILSINAAAARSLRFPAAALIGMRIQDVLTPEAHERFDEYIATIVQDGEALGSMSVRTRDGGIRTWDYHNRLHDGGGSQPVVHGIARDVTERELAVRAARRSEEHFRSIIENVSDLITIVDTAGVVEYASPSIHTILGLTPDQVIGRRCFGIIHPGDLDLAHTLFQRQTTRQELNTVALRFIHRDGSTRFVEVVAKNLMRGGRVTGVIATTRDITGRRMLEAQLEREQRLSSLGRLAATVAHEFNNVLMGMAPFAELMQRPGASAAASAKGARHISASITRGKRIVQEILRFTQPAEPALRAVDVASWGNAVLPEIRALTSTEIEIVSDFPADPLTVLADASQLTQVFANLVTNARDAMPKGGTIAIRARRPAAGATFPFGVIANPETYLHISLTDTGKGIPAAMLQQVFEPLYTSKATGTGLGLAVAHQVVSRHGGQIFVESPPGAGATFHIFLPATDAAPELASHPPIEGGCPPHIRARRLLMVEDEAAIVEGVAALLSVDDFEVTSVGTGEEAVDAIEAFRPDIVLLDVGLPGIDGIETHRRIRARNPHLAVILASGHETGQQHVGDDRTEYLQKPFTMSALFAAIATLEAGAP
jgi:PAS domain S-box-containing protein